MFFLLVFRTKESYRNTFDLNFVRSIIDRIEDSVSGNRRRMLLIPNLISFE